MPLIAAIVLFAIFALNVGLGSMSGDTFLTDVQEMLMLFASVIFFVIAILKREAAARMKGPKTVQGGHNGGQD